jgi:hypothetical protein
MLPRVSVSAVSDAVTVLFDLLPFGSASDAVDVLLNCCPLGLCQFCKPCECGLIILASVAAAAARQVLEEDGGMLRPNLHCCI